MSSLLQFSRQLARTVIDFDEIASRFPVARAFRPLLRLIPERAIVPVLQGPLRGSFWIRGSSVNACWLGSYEHRKQVVFWNALSPGDVVFDVGANVGVYTLLAAKRVGTEGRVFAFEPVPRNVRYLERHLRINRVDNATVLAVAVADTPGEARFDDSDHPSVGHLSSGGGLEVEVETLDHLVQIGAVDPPSCMKIDVEGAESAVIKGAREVLSRYRPEVFVSTHGEEQHRVTIELLESLGYTVSGVGGDPANATDELLATRSPASTDNSVPR